MYGVSLGLKKCIDANGHFAHCDDDLSCARATSLASAERVSRHHPKSEAKFGVHVGAGSRTAPTTFS